MPADSPTTARPLTQILPAIYIALALVLIVLLLRHPAAGPVAPAAASQKQPLIDIDSIAPDFTLRDAHGDPAQNPAITLSDLTKKQTVLLIFYLGYSCPRCMSTLRELEDHKAELDAAGVQILAIGPNTVEELRQSIDLYGDFPFPMLSDPDGKVAALYDLKCPDRDLHGCFLIDKSRTIRFAMASSHPYDNFEALINLSRGIKEDP